jgi:hypothetical protein
MAIAALAVWVCTAAAGIYLLTAVVAKRPGAAPLAAPPQAAPGAPDTASTPATIAPTASAAITGGAGPGQPGTAGTPPPGAGTPPPGAGTPPDVARTPPPIPRVKVSAPPGEHPVLEFCHPALGITGLACWFAFVATHDRTFAHVALVVLVITIVLGLCWAAANALAARRHADGGKPAIPAHRIVLHGLAATATGVLAIVAILATSHG